MKKTLKFYVNSPLILRIAIGLVIGICFGLFLPEATLIALFGSIFVGALKAIAPILVFVLVIASLANAGTGIGKRFGTVILFYLISTFLAAACAVVAYLEVYYTSTVSHLFTEQLSLRLIRSTEIWFCLCRKSKRFLGNGSYFPPQPST